MHAHPLISRVSHSVAFGGKCAFIFAPIFFVFLFATILMVGDGTAPSVTHLSAAILGFTVKLLGVSFEGAIVPAILFWSLVVFVVAFLYALISYRSQATPEDKKGWYWTSGVIVVVVGSVLLLVRNHRDEDASVREKALALEFVRNNTEIMRKVGNNLEVYPASYTTASDGQRVRYVFSVSAKSLSVADQNASTVYAVVGISRSTGFPAFSLECVTFPGQRISFNDPCRQ
jgi:hypothetical protein